MAKHDMGTPIKESLERHYQDEIKRLNTKINSLQAAVNELMLERERLNTVLEMKGKQIEVLLEKLVER